MGRPLSFPAEEKFPVKLLFCIKAMNNPGGGAERVLASVASGLAGRGYDVTVLSFERPGGRSFYPLDPRIVRIELGLGSTIGPATVPDTLRRIAALRVRVRQHAPDVAIGFMHSMFVPLGLALARTAIPMIASEHIVPIYYLSRPHEALLLCLTPFLVERITCVSEQVRRSYPGFLRRKMVAVANPVSVSVEGRADVSGSARSRKVLLTVGRLEPQKDHATLIGAFAEIAHRLPDWDLRIVGEGERRPKLESMIRVRKLSARVHLVGAVEEVSAEYLSAQLFVLPSRYESLGLTTAEALAHGLPAVGFDDCPGTNQLIRPGVNGNLAAGKRARRARAASLAETLMPLMIDDALRLRLSQQTSGIPDECRLETVLDHWEKLVREVRNATRTSG